MSYIEVEFKKPLWVNEKGAYIRLRKDTYIDQAISQGKQLKISIPGLGSAVHDPLEWLRTGTPSEQVFKLKDNPMKLIGNYVRVNIPQKKLFTNSPQRPFDTPQEEDVQLKIEF